MTLHFKYTYLKIGCRVTGNNRRLKEGLGLANEQWPCLQVCMGADCGCLLPTARGCPGGPCAPAGLCWKLGWVIYAAGWQRPGRGGVWRMSPVYCFYPAPAVILPKLFKSLSTAVFCVLFLSFPILHSQDVNSLLAKTGTRIVHP